MSQFLLGFLWRTWKIEGWIKSTPKHKDIIVFKTFLTSFLFTDKLLSDYTLLLFNPLKN